LTWSSYATFGLNPRYAMSSKKSLKSDMAL
jgi:hypothetical protein